MSINVAGGKRDIVVILTQSHVASHVVSVSPALIDPFLTHDGSSQANSHLHTLPSSASQLEGAEPYLVL